ncbi:MAG TPA: 16S rRNA (cytosine(1402)-N(4))-methyltransferase RsmH [Gammaproteobacteria bacterium]|nr:16S rRNA (cytosine(1402)-N(4))-methyltransferase RsmH [Gammaproteobacteria bacterium]
MVEGYPHSPVLLNEVLAGLNVQADGRYVDGTYGRGGHAAALLERLGSEGRLLAIDKDPEAVAAAARRFGGDSRFQVERGSFATLEQAIRRLGWYGAVSGVLLDLGVSSPQLDDARRGFSFLNEGPLDMRMDPDSGTSAADWLARASEREIADVLWRYGEERFSRRIARTLVAARAERPITTTAQLADLIARAVPGRERHKHPATRSFQGIRIYINHELEDLEEGLRQAVEVLAPGGRLAVISFHSLEDRMVKRFMRREAEGEPVPPDLPIRGPLPAGRLRIVAKAVKPGADELAANPRARSAVLRIGERVA